MGTSSHHNFIKHTHTHNAPPPPPCPGLMAYSLQGEAVFHPRANALAVDASSVDAPARQPLLFFFFSVINSRLIVCVCVMSLRLHRPRASLTHQARSEDPPHFTPSRSCRIVVSSNIVTSGVKHSDRDLHFYKQ